MRLPHRWERVLHKFGEYIEGLWKYELCRCAVSKVTAALPKLKFQPSQHNNFKYRFLPNKLQFYQSVNLMIGKFNSLITATEQNSELFTTLLCYHSDYVTVKFRLLQINKQTKKNPFILRKRLFLHITATESIQCRFQTVALWTWPVWQQINKYSDRSKPKLGNQSKYIYKILRQYFELSSIFFWCAAVNTRGLLSNVHAFVLSVWTRTFFFVTGHLVCA